MSISFSESGGESFAALCEFFLSDPDVTLPGGEPIPQKGFGSAALKVNGKIFAMCPRGSLIVKLPRKRVDELVDSGDGERFEPRGDGKLMKEWLVLSPNSPLEWLPLAHEAREFLASNPESSH